MKKILFSILILALLLGGATSVIADTYKSPAEIYADLKGITVDEAYNERATTNYTFGQLAEESALLEEYKSAILKYKENFLQERVTKGELTQDEAAALLERFKENQALCELGYGYGTGYGCPLNGNGKYYGKRNARWQNNGEAQEDSYWQGRGMRGGGFCGGRGF